MHRTVPAGIVSVGRERLGAGPAGDRPYVMRRGTLALKRTLFYVAVALWLATAALWVRGYFADDCIQWFINSRGGGTVRQTTITTRLFPGALSISRDYIEIVDSPFTVLYGSDDPWRRYERLGPGWVRYDLRSLWWPRLGFTWAAERSWGYEGFRATVPFWGFLVGLSCVAYSLRGARSRGGKRGHCATCGYDLRATPARCPECGSRSAATPAAA